MEDVTLLPPSALAPAIVLSPAPTLNEPYAQLIISQARQHTFHPNGHLSVAYGFKFAPMQPPAAPGFLEAASFALNLDLVGLWAGLVAAFLAVAGVFLACGAVLFGFVQGLLDAWETPDVLSALGAAVTAAAAWDVLDERLPAPAAQKHAASSTARRIAALLALGTITLALGSLHLMVAEGNPAVLESMLDLH